MNALPPLNLGLPVEAWEHPEVRARLGFADKSAQLAQAFASIDAAVRRTGLDLSKGPPVSELDADARLGLREAVRRRREAS